MRYTSIIVFLSLLVKKNIDFLAVKNNNSNIKSLLLVAQQSN